MNVILKDGIRNITEYPSAFEKLNVLFVENAEKEVAILYKGKKFFQANSSERTGKFLDYLYKKSAGNTAKLEEEMSRLAGMAENLTPSFSITVEKFETGWKALQETEITAENAMDYLDNALIYFNHHVIDGKVVQIADENCVEVVKVVDEYRKTGKITKAKVSDTQNISVLEEIFSGNFSRKTIPQLKHNMKEGETGIIFGDRGVFKKGHVFNIIKKDGNLMLKDGQNGLDANLRQGYISFHY